MLGRREGADSKQSIREALESAVAANSATAGAILDGPPMPKNQASAVVWSWFQSLQEERLSNGYGPLPFTTPQIIAWADDNGLTIPPWAKRCIKRLDAVFIESMTIDNDNVHRYFFEPKET